MTTNFTEAFRAALEIVQALPEGEAESIDDVLASGGLAEGDRAYHARQAANHRALAGPYCGHCDGEHAPNRCPHIARIAGRL
jgi:hypothetical protein